jgi:hypothetical protein
MKQQIESEVSRVLELSAEDFLLMMADVYELRTKAQDLLAQLSAD